MLKNPNPIPVLRPGLHVWYEERWTGIIAEGEIKDLKTETVTENGVSRLTSIVDLSGITLSGSVSVPCNCIFPDRESALAAQNASRLDRIESFKAMMVSAEDIVHFAWTHPVAHCEEYTDYEAREAFKTQVEVVLGIVL